MIGTVRLSVDSCASGNGFDRVLDLTPNGVVHIGRASSHKGVAPAPDNAMFENSVMSRRHAYFTARGGLPASLTITDTSRYGTFINGTRITPDTPCRLASGDSIRFGDPVTAKGASTTSPPITVIVAFNDQHATSHKSSNTFQAPIDDFSEVSDDEFDDFVPLDNIEESQLQSGPALMTMTSKAPHLFDTPVWAEVEASQTAPAISQNRSGELLFQEDDDDCVEVEEDSTRSVRQSTGPLPLSTQTIVDLTHEGGIEDTPVQHDVVVYGNSKDSATGGDQNRPSTTKDAMDMSVTYPDLTQADNFNSIRSQTSDSCHRLLDSMQAGQHSFDDSLSGSWSAQDDFAAFSSSPVRSALVVERPPLIASVESQDAPSSRVNRVSIEDLMNPESMPDNNQDATPFKSCGRFTQHVLDKETNGETKGGTKRNKHEHGKRWSNSYKISKSVNRPYMSSHSKAFVKAALQKTLQAGFFATLGSVATIGILASPIGARLAGV